MYTSIHDTIVAVSSAPGHAPRGIVRLSGPDAIPIANHLFRADDARPLTETAGFTAHHGEVIWDNLHSVPATVYLFRKPRSYTRQDMVEFHTVGSPPVLEMMIERCLSGNARLAEPGEFTARAFLAGAMGLTEAEAVASTIRARSDVQLRAARRQMSGHFADQIRCWQDELADLLSLVVADIDFTEEPIDFISPKQLTTRLTRLQERLREIMRTADNTERFDVLPYVLLLGPPNAGKSTLLNTLSGMDRAIASAVSGTTRDILAAPIKLGPLEAVMLDAAGMDNNPDEIIVHGQQRAVEAAATVELVCLVFDASQPVNRTEVVRLANLTDAPTVVAANKADALDVETARKRHADFKSCHVGSVRMVSATGGTGIDELRALLERKLATRHEPAGGDILLSARQRNALAEAEAALDRTVAIVAETDGILDVAELIAFELQQALDALGLIAGTVTTEDLLNRVFASFCIGK